MQNEKGHTTISPIPSEELYRFGADGNLRMFSYDRLFFALYGYDGGTTRTYKYSFDLTPNWVNGQLLDVQFNPHNAMFYPNSYLNFNQDGYYTKHYYNGMERIASRLGEQSLPISTHDPEPQDRKDWQDSLIRKQISDISGYQFLEPGQEPDPDDPKPVFELPQVGITGLQPIGSGDIFYYHPNHLGSTCYVTDDNTSVVQGFLYAPFGEITNEYNSSFGSSVLPKYSFNAKELDEETGFYYYEARYYNPPTFVSRDPLFEKYPTISPYTYCANNPVKFIDPTGEEIYAIYNKETQKLYVVDLDHYQKDLPVKHVSAKDYQLGGIRDKNGNLTHNQVLVINNVFSGGQVEDGKIVRDASDTRQKAIPNAKYDIVDNNTDTRHDGWFRLDRQDNKKYNDKDDVTGRDGYRFHLGGLSWGCVTVDETQDDAQESWDVLSSIMNSTSTTVVSEKRGRQWLNPFSKLTRYGVMVVKGTDKTPKKTKEKEQ